MSKILLIQTFNFERDFNTDISGSPLLIYLQSGSVYIFGESVAPSGGDYKCFIWVYLTRVSDNCTGLTLHTAQFIRLNTLNVLDEILQVNTIPYTQLWRRNTTNQFIITWNHVILFFYMMSFWLMPVYLWFPSWPHCCCQTGTGNNLHSEAAIEEQNVLVLWNVQEKHVLIHWLWEGGKKNTDVKNLFQNMMYFLVESKSFISVPILIWDQPILRNRDQKSCTHPLDAVPSVSW